MAKWNAILQAWRLREKDQLRDEKQDQLSIVWVDSTSEAKRYSAMCDRAEPNKKNNNDSGGNEEWDEKPFICGNLPLGHLLISDFRENTGEEKSNCPKCFDFNTKFGGVWLKIHLRHRKKETQSKNNVSRTKSWESTQQQTVSDWITSTQVPLVGEPVSGRSFLMSNS